jgi:hypothetical protein
MTKMDQRVGTFIANWLQTGNVAVIGRKRSLRIPGMTPSLPEFAPPRSSFPSGAKLKPKQGENRDENDQELPKG